MTEWLYDALTWLDNQTGWRWNWLLGVRMYLNRRLK